MNSQVSSSEHIRLYNKAQAMLERARCSQLFSVTSYIHEARGVTLSISLTKKRDYVAVYVLSAFEPGATKSKIPHTTSLLEAIEKLASVVREARIDAVASAKVRGMLV